ncbi:MAG TPA: anti-sigma factor [Solirubrobacteraceae bacterium]
MQELPSDQKAVLSLLLRQGKSYAQIASLLSIDQEAVRNRAYEAIRSLGAAEGTSLLRAQRQEIADFLLGQAGSLSQSTTTYLDSLANARSWAERVRSQLQELSPSPLPELPAPPSSSSEQPAAAPPPEPTPPAPPEQEDQSPTAEPATLSGPVSRRGGAILLVAMLAVIVLAVVLIADRGGSGGKASQTQPATTAGSSSTSTSAIHLDSQLNLNPPLPGSKAKGVVEIASEGKRRAFYLVAEGLQPTNGFFYVAWLYNSQHEAEPLGKAPTVGSNGRLQAAAPLPSDAGKFHQLILTRETSEGASEPGEVVLKGSFSLHGKTPPAKGAVAEERR